VELLLRRLITDATSKSLYLERRISGPTGSSSKVMKRVEAILTPYKLDAVADLLIERGCQDIVVSEVKGSEIRDRRTSRYRSVEYVIDLPPKVKLEVVVGDAEAMPTVQAILHASQCGSTTDESVSIGPLEQVVSIGISRPNRYTPRRLAKPKA